MRADDVALLPDRDSRMAKRLADLQEFKVGEVWWWYKCKVNVKVEGGEGGETHVAACQTGVCGWDELGAGQAWGAGRWLVTGSGAVVSAADTEVHPTHVCSPPLQVSPLVDFWKAQEVTQSRTDGGGGSQPCSRRGSGAHMLPRPLPSTFGGALPTGHASPSAAASSACAAELPSLPGSPPDTDFREAAAAIMHGSVTCRGGGSGGGAAAGTGGVGGGADLDALSAGGLSAEASYGQLLENAGSGFGATVAAGAAAEVQAS